MKITQKIDAMRRDVIDRGGELAQCRDVHKDLLSHPIVRSFLSNCKRMNTLSDEYDDRKMELDRHVLLNKERPDLCAMVDSGEIEFEYAMEVYSNDLLAGCSIQDTPEVLGNWLRHPIP